MRPVVHIRNQIISQQISVISVCILIGFVILSFIVLYASLAMGKSILSVTQVIDAIQGEGTAIYKIFVNKLRMPRTLISFMAGGMLACAGYFMQLATKNPLASPTLTGVSDASALGAVFFLAVYSDAQGNMTNDFDTLPLFALSSGMLGLGVVLWLNKVIKGGTTTFILIGVTVAILSKATTSFLMLVSPIYRSEQAALWLSGSVSGAKMSQVSTLFPLFMGTVVIAILFSRIFKVMILNPYTIDSIGGNNRIYNLCLILIAGIITAIAVSYTGPIGFVGILVPHIVRKIAPDTYGTIKVLMILLLGGIIVCGGDVIGRTIVAPIQIPVGIMTSIVGGLVFLVLFYKKGKKL